MTALTLGVQPVEEGAYDAIVEMGRRGGFEADSKPKKAKGKRAKEEDGESGDEAPPAKNSTPKPAKAEKPSSKTKNPPAEDAKEKPAAKKAKAEPKPRPEGTRRSSRLKN